MSADDSKTVELPGKPQGEATVEEKSRRSPDPDFGPRYRVLDVLGKGGMGEVYRAYDTELKSEIAVKVVRSSSDEQGALARFRREIALARKVTSANVLRVYDLAEYKGLQFLTMEFVDGEDLATMMKRERHMPLERALAIFRQVCTGLAAAHAQGVVHRDLKPQNVLVDKEGHVRVADFGLARSINESGLTMTGAILGSPAYMSPEQVKGDPVDERSDIYSLGILLYQLVAFEPPFRAATPHGVMEMRLHKKPRPLREVNPDAPAHLEPIVARCLELDATARYAKVSDLIADLDSDRTPPAAPARERRWALPVIVGAASAAVAGIVVWRSVQSSAPAPSAPAPPSEASHPTSDRVEVLLLGVDNRTGDPSFDETVDGVLKYALRRSRHIDPIQGLDLHQLAADLKLGLPVDEGFAVKLAARDHDRVLIARGFVVKKEAGVAITVTMTDSTKHVVFQDTQVAPTLAGVVPAIGRLASGIREAVGEPVPTAEREQTGMSASLDATHEYVVGYTMGRAGNYEGQIAHMQHALADDPTFAWAHFSLANAYWNTNRRGDSVKEDELGLRNIDQVGERDRLTLLGIYYLQNTQDYDRAIATFERYLQLWPGESFAVSNLAIAYQSRGNFKKALELASDDERAHPGDLLGALNVGELEVEAGELDRAITDLRKLADSSARPPAAAYEYLGLASALAGDRSAALSAYERFSKVDASGGVTALADLALAEGRLGDAKQLLEHGISDDRAHAQPDAVEIKQAMLAELELRLGDKAAARSAAVAVSDQGPQLLAAATVLLAVGDDKAAIAISARLTDDVAATRRTIAKLIDGEVLRAHGKPQQAMLAIQDALKLVDMPIGHYLMARAALDAKRFGEAYDELKLCMQRRGELTVGADDVPNYRYVPPLTYYLGRAQEGLGSPEARASYKAFLAMTHDANPSDPLVADAQRRLK
jgi:serine/threonine protein kinase/tetratricopeptide (TPR) repeat protein